MRSRNESRNSSNPLDNILGNSEAIRQVKSMIRQVATSDISVLVTGESGTGKELVAAAIHSISQRSSQPLVTLNCGAIPEGIFESEIFGHEKGSFTSADQRRLGYFEMADNSTLFLDEIGEMPLSVQVKILRVLETGSFQRVGGNREIKVNVRVIAATNKDLAMEASEGRFRQDLYFRLKTVNIEIPPLRERIGDIEPLAEFFIRRFAERNRKVTPRLEPDALTMLERSYWAGNVRELKNFVESVVALSDRNVISAVEIRDRLSSETANANLPVLVRQTPGELDRELIYRTLLDVRQDLSAMRSMLQELIRNRDGEVQNRFSEAEEIDSYSLDDLERDQIQRVLTQFDGNRRLASEALGIGERTLYRKLKHYDIK